MVKIDGLEYNGKSMGGGDSSKSPDGQWTVVVTDGSISTGVHGVRMNVYRGDAPSGNEKSPFITFEAPLQDFDARSRATKDEWIEDGKACRFVLDAYYGEAVLTVNPSESRILYEPFSRSGMEHRFATGDWIVLAVLMLVVGFWMISNHFQRDQDSSRSL